MFLILKYLYIVLFVEIVNNFEKLERTNSRLQNSNFLNIRLILICINSKINLLINLKKYSLRSLALLFFCIHS